MPEYKLTYFKARGAAEFLRFIFHHKGVKFTDEQVTREEWPALKESKFYANLNLKI